MQKIKSLVLGITGGIAAYKAAELVRLFIKDGINVQVVMTSAACEFITPTTMQALSGNPVYIEMWDGAIGNGMPHIELSRNADAILVAPASANFMSKLVHGSADDLLSTLCLARDCPLLVAPAMNKQMWENPATQRNVNQLKADGIEVLGPDSGEQACGELGLGRMLEPEQIFSDVHAWQQPKLFAGKHILLTVGATVESIDPVRGITNFSSGKMGLSLAQAAIEMGAEVTIVCGKVTVPVPEKCNRINAESAQAMHEAVMSEVAKCDVFIGVAAVADYRPAQSSVQKIKKSDEHLMLELIPNPDILKDVANLANPPYCVGFAAESQDVLALAAEKRKRKNIPMIVANHASVMGQDDSQVTVIDNHGEHPPMIGRKLDIARQILTCLQSNL